MQVNFSPISGVMFGFELVDDDDFSYVVVDFIILRIMFIREI